MVFPKQRINEFDWDFPDETTQYLTHKYHSYPARFIPQLPKTVIEIFFDHPNNKIFDPFLGCGTVLVESVLSRNHAGGSDLNPLSILISKVKTKPLDIITLKSIWLSFQKLENRMKSDTNQTSLDNFLEKKEQFIDIKPKQFIFPNRIITERFTPENTYNISLVLDFIDQEISDSDFIDFFKVGLSSTITTLVESRKWDKINIWSTFKTKINGMIKTMEEFVNAIDNFENVLQKDIKLCDSRKLDYVQNDTIDCVITSPPYVNALDYNRIHQYNMSILGYDYRKFARNEIGAHGHHINNRWRLLTEYLADMYRSIAEMNRIVKNNGIICIVIGNSCIEYETINSSKHIAQIGEDIGLLHELSITRNIAVEKKHTNQEVGNILQEDLIFLKKVEDYTTPSDNQIFDFVEKQLNKYETHVRTSKGTCLRNKPELSDERRKLAVFRVNEAIEKIKVDCIFKIK